MTILRSLLEKAVRGKMVKRRLPNGAKIYVSPDSQLKYLKRKFDTDLTELAKSHVNSQSVVWDVGSNCGVLAFSSAGARQIIAVEADPFLCNMLQRSVELSGIDVIVVAAAAYSEPSLAMFSIANRGRASNHLSAFKGSTQSKGDRGQILVPTIRLDDLLDRLLPPTLIKIDVEGAELHVLAGAKRILRDVRPIFYIESGDETRDSCHRIFQDAGYGMELGAEMNWICTPL